MRLRSTWPFVGMLSLAFLSACSKSLVLDPLPDVAAPAAVDDLVAPERTTTSVKLRWTAPGDDGTAGTANSYDVRYSTAPITGDNFAAALSAQGEPHPSAAGQPDSVTVVGLTPGTTYYFALEAADEVPNVSEVSNVVAKATASGPPVDATPPAAVTNLAPTTTTTSSITLTWTAPGDDGTVGTAALYDLRYSTSVINEANFGAATQVTGEPAPGAAGSTQSKSVTGLSAGTTYYFALKTSDEVPNVSGLSNIASGATTSTPPPDVTAPAAVTNLAPTTTATSSITLTWTAPGDDGTVGTAALYDLRYSTSVITEANFGAATQVTGEPAPAAAGSTQSKTVTGLSAGTTYYFALKTSDEVPNVSGLSNIASGATTSTPPPDVTAPAAVTNLAPTTTTTSSITLTWTAPGDDGTVGTAALYDLRYSTSVITEANFGAATQVTGEPAPGAAGSTQSKNVTGLSAGTTYYFALKTSDEVPNVSQLSNVASGATNEPDVTAPATVNNLAPTSITKNSITLTWTAPGDDGTIGTAALYDLRYSTSEITDANFASATAVSEEPEPAAAGTTQSKKVTGLSRETTYYFALRTLDEVSNISGLSNVVSASTDDDAPNLSTPEDVSDALTQRRARLVGAPFRRGR